MRAVCSVKNMKYVCACVRAYRLPIHFLMRSLREGIVVQSEDEL